jgi:tRNA threonylcarbamoyladenosine biosynthesis protein TsaB
MLTLALDTSCLTASCAVCEDGKLIGELTLQHGKTHSQKIIPMVKSLLDFLDKDFKDVDLFAASIGPGSFTGLRIGVVTVKGLAYSLKKPVCGIPTLDALAYSVPDFGGLIIPMLDARNNQVFTAAFRKDRQTLDKVWPDMGLTIEELMDQIRSSEEKVMVLGDAVPLHIEKLREAFPQRVIEAPPSLFTPRASCCAILAERAYHNNQALNAFELEPLYLRKSQAERMRDLSRG